MDLPQIYTTTLLNPSNREMRWQFLTIPFRFTRGMGASPLLQALRLRSIRHINPSFLPFLVTSMLESENPDEVLSKAEQYAQIWSRETLSDQTSETLKFAEQVVFRQLVPFDRSPLPFSQESLANIVATTTEADNNDTLLVESEGHYFLTVISPDGVVISSRPQHFIDIWETILHWLGGS